MSDPDTRFKLTVHYDGSAFAGWQAQPSGPTVQGELERVVATLAGSRRRVFGAGRTDAGVHACGQAAAVDMPAQWTEDGLARSLNALLPDAVWIERVQIVPGDFDARRHAVSRTYAYRVGTGPEAASPFRRRWCWPLLEAIDLERARAAAKVLAGEHDFRAFAKAGPPERGHACRVERARWRPWSAPRATGATFEITANRFLHRMVRRLVGTMVEIARGRRPESDMEGLLDGEPGLVASRPAPPQGLFLARVGYRQEADAADARRSRPDAKRRLERPVAPKRDGRKIPAAGRREWT